MEQIRDRDDARELLTVIRFFRSFMRRLLRCAHSHRSVDLFLSDPSLSTLHTRSILRLYAALCLQINDFERCKLLFLPSIFISLYKLTNNEHTPAEVTQAAQEVADVLKKAFGAPAFHEEYDVARKIVEDQRLARKREFASELVADPVRAARRKIRRVVRKKTFVDWAAGAEGGCFLYKYYFC